MEEAVVVEAEAEEEVDEAEDGDVAAVEDEVDLATTTHMNLGTNMALSG